MHRLKETGLTVQKSNYAQVTQITKASKNMQIAIHIGANCTDEDRLIKSLLKNVDAFANDGVAIPQPGLYRATLRELLQGKNRGAISATARDAVLDGMSVDENTQRLVISNGNFICIPKRIFDNGVFYGQAELKMRAFQQLFAPDEISLYLGIRNPATFLYETFKRSEAGSIDAFLGIMRPNEIKWSDVVRRIKQAVPEVPLTVWCNEDTPLLWDQIMRKMANMPEASPLVGGTDMLSSIITRQGRQQLQTQYANAAGQPAAARHDMMADIWEQFAQEGSAEDEIDLPQLSPEQIAQMTEDYDADVDLIRQMQGVEMMLPFR